MRKYGMVVLVGVFYLFIACTVIAAEAEKAKAEADKQDKKKPASGSGLFINYKPPMLGKPGNRIGGGTRGKDKDIALFAALVPEHTGLTSKPEPSLCWYMSKPMNTRIEVTLNDEKSVNPILEKTLDLPAKGGVHCLRLSDYNTRLRADIEYQWFVAIVPDPAQRSKDILSGGTILYREASPELTRRLARASGADIPSIYAESGIWYDAVSSVSDLITANPGNKEYRKMRADLLEQAGLSEVAKVEAGK